MSKVPVNICRLLLFCRPLRAAVLAIGLLAAGGCLAPPDVRPELPTSPDWPQEYAGDTTLGARAPGLGWRDFLIDPRLDVLIATALQRNRDLAVAVLQIEEARGLYRIQRADRLPTINADAGAARTRLGLEGAEASGGGLPIGGPDTTFDSYSISVAMPAFELDFWGRVRNLSEAARAQYLGTVEAARAFQLSLIREVAFAYLASLEASERIDLAEATVRSRKDGLRIARRRLDAGVTSALDFRQAETLLTQAEIELAALRLSRAQSENALTVLIGGPLAETLPDPLPLARQANLETLAAGLPSEVLTARPDILAAEEQLRAARANVGAARAAFFPSIVLTGNFGYASPALGDLFSEDAKTWSYGPSINLPIFDFGRRRGNLTVAEARENIAIATYQRAIQTGFQEVSDALAGRRYLAEQVDAQERGTLAQRQLAELARTRYREGVVSYLEVLDAERNLFSAEQALLQVRRSQVANLVSLYVALGGGSIESR